MFRSSLVLLPALIVLSYSIASPIDSETELVDDIGRGQAQYKRYIQWIADQPVDSDTSLTNFYELIGNENGERELVEPLPAQSEPEEFQVEPNSEELQNKYEDWKKVQPEGSGSFQNFLQWLRAVQTLRNLDADDSEEADNVVAKRSLCTVLCPWWFCKC